MRFSEDFLAALASRIDIEDLIGRYAEVRHRGTRRPVCLCPFHTEKTPSLNIYPENWSFYCFGCGVGGSGITFIQRIENLSYVEAVRFLCQQVGMAMPDETDGDEGVRLRRRCYEANREAARFFASALTKPAAEEARRYLYEKRGLDEKTVKAFGLGYAPDDWRSLTTYLKGKGYSEEELVAFNLAARSRKSSNVYDVFRNRLMIPIIDVRGNVVAFGGRVLDDSKPKYVNTSDTVVYKKGQAIYALNFAKTNKDRKLILCEGYMDVISMHQAGFTNAVAALGTAFTSDQVNLLARYCDEIYLSFDADEAGQKATAKAMRMLENSPMTVRILNLEGGKDPDEILKTEGAGRMRQFLNDAPNETEFRLNSAKKKFDLRTDDGRVGYLKEAAAILAAVRSPVERDVYVGRVVAETHTSRDSLEREVASQQKRLDRRETAERFRTEANESFGADRKIKNPERRANLRASKAEETILASLLLNPDYLKRFSSRLRAEDFVTQVNRELYEGFAKRIAEGRSLSLAAFSEGADEDLMSNLAYLTDLGARIAGTPEEYEDCVRTLLEEKAKKQMTSAGPVSDEDFLKMMEALRKKKVPGSDPTRR